MNLKLANENGKHVPENEDDLAIDNLLLSFKIENCKKKYNHRILIKRNLLCWIAGNQNRRKLR